LLFSGLAIKMAAVIYLSILGGQYLDARAGFGTPWFTLAGSLLGVGVSMYYVFQDLKKL
jgi:hypothetical protein